MKKLLIATSAVLLAMSTSAFADTISPETFSAELAVGESTTIRKTVVVEAAGTSTALIDAAFLIDTSGSMGGEINQAKAAAGDIIAALQGFGNAAASVGVFSENAGLEGSTCITFCSPTNPVLSKPGTVLNQDITTNAADITAAINAVTLSTPDGGGSFPESTNTAVDLVANNASWRPGSNRFIFAFGDASSNKFISDADVMASLAANNVTLVGISYSGSFSSSITDLGGTVFAGGTSTADVVSAITSGITTGLSTYSNVTVDDLGGGLPQIGVSTVCVSAAGGTCVGDTATGAFDRTVDRTFEFDVTFTRFAAGTTTFDTFALVDGGITATEVDTFTTPGGPVIPPVPLPASVWMLLAAFGGLFGMSRRKAA